MCIYVYAFVCVLVSSCVHVCMHSILHALLFSSCRYFKYFLQLSFTSQYWLSHLELILSPLKFDGILVCCLHSFFAWPVQWEV